jgi:hypothetical protein
MRERLLDTHAHSPAALAMMHSITKQGSDT